jgi:hypothetical protein
VGLGFVGRGEGRGVGLGFVGRGVGLGVFGRGVGLGVAGMWQAQAGSFGQPRLHSAREAVFWKQPCFPEQQSSSEPQASPSSAQGGS